MFNNILYSFLVRVPKLFEVVLPLVLPVRPQPNNAGRSMLNPETHWPGTWEGLGACNPEMFHIQVSASSAYLKGSYASATRHSNAALDLLCGYRTRCVSP